MCGELPVRRRDPERKGVRSCVSSLTVFRANTGEIFRPVSANLKILFHPFSVKLSFGMKNRQKTEPKFSPGTGGLTGLG